ncbi:exosome complex component rrp46 [Lichtheimia corymbifera JMRC:FSU:9682]|uniref:Exosome complex component rrp46 n=1 Tax=Lichtheimia corymbifera JMRC:FSU:9682 TaxID=1263082 RepID=A0A068S5Z9_9FUNG|nr:exosome complex component rrp46 [Lichtheimia corymbifera JMRC:FSU:9682]
MRPDRRTENTQLRSFSSSQNVLNQADGSATFDLGETSVMVSVLGPVEVPLRDEKMDEATVEVVVRPSMGVPATKEKLMEQTLRRAIEPVILGGMMPRTLIQIVVQILKDDGSAIAASLNAMSLALVDAGVPMKFMIASMSCMIDRITNEIVMDPTTKELENASSVHTFAFDNLSATPNILLSDSRGDFSQKQYFECHDKCLNAVEKVHDFLRMAVNSKKEKEYQQLSNE